MVTKVTIPCIVNMLFVVGCIKFKRFFLKIIRVGAFWISGSNLLHSLMTDGKVLKKLCLTLKWGISLMFLVKKDLKNLKIKLKVCFGDWSFKILQRLQA